MFRCPDPHGREVVSKYGCRRRRKVCSNCWIDALLNIYLFLYSSGKRVDYSISFYQRDWCAARSLVGQRSTHTHIHSNQLCNAQRVEKLICEFQIIFLIQKTTDAEHNRGRGGKGGAQDIHDGQIQQTRWVLEPTVERNEIRIELWVNNEIEISLNTLAKETEEVRWGGESPSFVESARDGLSWVFRIWSGEVFRYLPWTVVDSGERSTTTGGFSRGTKDKRWAALLVGLPFRALDRESQSSPNADFTCVCELTQNLHIR